jgi:hypothetical protein
MDGGLIRRAHECATGAWIRKIGTRTSINTQPLILQAAVQHRVDNKHPGENQRRPRVLVGRFDCRIQRMHIAGHPDFRFLSPISVVGMWHLADSMRKVSGDLTSSTYCLGRRRGKNWERLSYRKQVTAVAETQTIHVIRKPPAR